MDPILTRLPKGEDILESINAFCKAKGITKASVQVIGALEKATLAYYHQDTHVYDDHLVETPVELLSGLGNVSLKDGEPFTHMHVVLSDKDGRCVGGHLMPGTAPVFAAEIVITPIAGADLVRGFDEATDLPLWEEYERA